METQKQHVEMKKMKEMMVSGLIDFPIKNEKIELPIMIDTMKHAKMIP